MTKLAFAQLAVVALAGNDHCRSALLHSLRLSYGPVLVMDIAGTEEPEIVAPDSKQLEGAGVVLSPRGEPAGNVEAKGSISP
ncbi:hypothetical protein RJJ65_20610 [Rhizobium hidalgonense]|uniref:Uncharacterized protein n=1 Tax=Rhizobium hidalgonense TaxID=1538159 RepID=A0AAJ2GU78_9HYPH|nr:hypothetical protein [Rhizobium hidalgonense]MDR9775011.1 hypothetical protein [Rhizobium hidalgonense]MDR9823491.1 hypothetical protein [Rhizobium hidalgonense]